MGIGITIGFLLFALLVLVAFAFYEKTIDRKHEARRADFQAGREHLEEQLRKLDEEEQ